MAHEYDDPTRSRVELDEDPTRGAGERAEHDEDPTRGAGERFDDADEESDDEPDEDAPVEDPMRSGAE